MTDKMIPRSIDPEGTSSIPLGTFLWFGFKVPFADRVRMIRDAGFDSTCLWWEERNAERRRLRHLVPDIVRRADLRIDNMHVPYEGCAALWSDNAEERNRIVEQHIGWVKDCARHDVSMMVMHVALGKGTPKANVHGLESMGRVLDAAEDSGVTIAIENTRSPAHVSYLLESIDSPRLGLCFDTSHDWLYGASPFELLRRWKHRLVCTHISDTDGRRDRHWLPGEGVIDFGAFGDVFSGTKFKGSLLLEPTPRDKSEDPVRFLERACLLASSLRDRLAGGATSPLVRRGW